MDLTLSRKGDYVVRAAIALARAWEGGGYRKIREVADEMDLPLSYTPRILALLAEAGLATAKAGREGGYRLLRSPKEITLLAVVEAGDGELTSERCTLLGGPCRWDDVCALHPAWSKATKVFKESLGQTTLESIAAVDRALDQGKFETPPDSHRTRVLRDRAQRPTEHVAAGLD